MTKILLYFFLILYIPLYAQQGNNGQVIINIKKAENRKISIKVHIVDQLTKKTLDSARVIACINSSAIDSTDECVDGYYKIDNLSPGQYGIRIIKKGYEINEVTGISIEEDKTRYVEVDMKKLPTGKKKGKH